MKKMNRTIILFTKVVMVPIWKNADRPYSTDKNINKTELLRIQEIIDSVKETENFKIAFTHRSCLYDNNKLKTYETFEFLGDSLLEHYTSLFIYISFPDYSEGQLTKLRTQLVEGKNLSKLSKKIGLGEYLKFGSSFIKQYKGIIPDKIKEKYLGEVFESFNNELYFEKEEKFLI